LERKVDRARYQASLDRLYHIFKEMSDTVSEVSRWRCPYKNVQDHCTANFGCRNQLRVDTQSLPACVGSDKLDYRSAWEV
jgi:hypothetical protein